MPRSTTWWCRNAITPASSLLTDKPSGSLGCPDHLRGGAKMPSHLLLPYWQVSQQDHWDVQITCVVVQKRHQTRFFPTDRSASRITWMSPSWWFRNAITPVSILWDCWASRIKGCPEYEHGGSEMPSLPLLPYRQGSRQYHLDVLISFMVTPSHWLWVSLLLE